MKENEKIEKDKVNKPTTSKENQKTQKSKVKVDMPIVSEKNENELDSKIWVTNKIEEAKQETESLICDKIKALDYEKTIKDLNASLKKLNKEIKQVDYNKDRALEILEQDFSLKLDDVKVIEESLLEDKIIDLTDESIKKSVSFLEKKLNNQIKKIVQDTSQENNKKREEAFREAFEEYKDTTNGEIKRYQEAANIEIEKELIQKLEKYDTLINSKLNEEKLNIEIENLKQNLIKLEDKISKQLGDVEEDLKNKIQEEELKRNEMFSKKIKEMNIESIKENIQTISIKVNELDSINQKKLDKIRKEQEKFITNKITEIDPTEKINEIKTELQNALNKLQNVQESINKTQENNFKELQEKWDILQKNNLKELAEKINNSETNSLKQLKEIVKNSQKSNFENLKEIISTYQQKNLEQLQGYIEKRILRMKLVSTTQFMMKEINKLKEKVKVLQVAQQNDEDDENPIKDIDSIVERKVKEVISQMLKEQKAKKNQKAKVAAQNIKEETKKETNMAKTKAVAKNQNIAYIQPVEQKQKVQHTQQTNKAKTTTKKIAKEEGKILTQQKMPTSINDMLAARGEKIDSKANTVTKSISNITKAVKKSQILNFDN